MDLSALEEADFGNLVGIQSLYQLPYQQFQLECLSANLAKGDSTGLRAYSGSHVAIRCLAVFRELVQDRTVVELGCGVGVYGLLGTSTATTKFLMLTDGEQRALTIIPKNIEQMESRKCGGSVDYQLLPWGNQTAIENALNKCEEHNNVRRFDVVLGCELMYFNTDLDLLINTVLSLTNHTGLFVHAHLFRAPNQENEMIEVLGRYGWATLEIPSHLFLTPTELDQHVEWRRVRCLVSGPIENMSKLSQEHSDWIPFEEEIKYGDDCESAEAETINIFS